MNLRGRSRAGTVLRIATILLASCGVATDPSASGGGGDCATGLRGVDVSTFNGDVDWAAVADNGISFAFAKASEGLTIRDDRFAANWAGMKASGLVRGAYHFFRPDDDGTAQADLFLDCVGPIGLGDLSPVLDWETSGEAGPAATITAAQDFAAEIQARTGRTTIVYTYLSYWESIGEPAQFAANPLWLASDQPDCPTPPTPWSNWLFWQYSDEGGVPGVSGAVDLDQFAGSRTELLSVAEADAGMPADDGAGSPVVSAGDAGQDSGALSTQSSGCGQGGGGSMIACLWMLGWVVRRHRGWRHS